LYHVPEAKSLHSFRNLGDRYRSRQSFRHWQTHPLLATIGSAPSSAG
jgi:hypothetical protein